MKLQLLAACVLFTLVSTAQQTPKPLDLKYKPIEEPKWSMFNIFRVHLQDFAVTDKYNDTCNCLESTKFLEKANANVGLSLYKNVDDKLAYSVDMMLGYGYVARKSSTALERERSWLGTARADVYYHLMSSAMQLRPYLFGALHSSFRRGVLLASLPVGAGARYMFFNNQAMITAQVGYGLGLTNRIRNNVIYSSGLYVNLNKKQKPHELDLGTRADGVVTKKHAGQSSCYNCEAVVDTDCDGVTDAIDKCPTVPGLASNNGCPVSDRDGDGVVDERDNCPDVAGPVNNTGCPVPVVSDRDKDGVVDQMDKCPDVAGPVNNEGCPVPAVSDRDKDGVLDQMDKCPDLAGVASNDGCPVSITRVVPLPAAASVPKVAPEIVAAPLPVPSVSATSDAAPIFIIHFNFDRYNLTYSAVKILDEVVAYCKINKTKRVYLYGHTDLEGGDQYNIKLSMNRVNIAKAYLLGKGVEASRIITDHFGKAQPALSTVEKSLGWKNRRVEIKIVN